MTQTPIQRETGLSTDTRHNNHDRAVASIPTTGSKVQSIHPGDVVFFTRKRIHALIRCAGDYSNDATNAPEQPDRVDIVWLDGYDRSFRTHNIRRETLERMGEKNRLRLTDEFVPNAEAIGRAPGVRHPKQYHRDITVQPGARLPVSNMSFERTYSLKLVNGFLKHPVVDHKQDRVQKAKAMFMARRPDDQIAAVVTVNSVNARMAFDRSTVEITRYASHPETSNTRRTNNTATWMLSRVCDWAALEGYEQVRTMAGTDGNEGQIYKASNFTYDGIAESSGEYNREGRQNQSHSQALRRYIRNVNVDGENAGSGFPRRLEGRLDANQETTGDATTLSAFTKPPREATPAQFRFTREEASDHKFTVGDSTDEYPVFSPELKQLIRETEAPIPLGGLTDSRGRHIPAAVFGASVDGELVAALLVGGDPSDTIPTARVAGYAARPTAYPDATARWLLTRARDWCELNPYESLTVPEGTFAHVDNVNTSVPSGIGFTSSGDGGYHYPNREPVTKTNENTQTPIVAAIHNN